MVQALGGRHRVLGGGDGRGRRRHGAAESIAPTRYVVGETRRSPRTRGGGDGAQGSGPGHESHGSEDRRGGPAAPLGPAAPGARPHAGGLRGARGLPPAARLPARPHAPGARALRPRRPARLRPVQHPLHLRHRHRRVGARQAHALVPADRQRRALGVGLRLGRAPPPALRAVDARAEQSLAGMVGMRGAVSPKAGLFKQAAQEIKDILEARGRGRHAARHRRGRAAVPVRAAGAGPRGARRPAGDAGGAR